MDLEAPAPAPRGVLPRLKRVLSPVVGAVRGVTKVVSKVLSPPRKQQRPDADDEPARAALDFDAAAAALADVEKMTVKQLRKALQERDVEFKKGDPKRILKAMLLGHMGL